MFLDGENEIIHENFISKLQIVHKHYMAHCSRDSAAWWLKAQLLHLHPCDFRQRKTLMPQLPHP